MPLNLSFTHIMVVLIVALIVLGPERLPDAARKVAGAIAELRKLSAGLQAEVRDTFGDFAEPFTDLVSTVSGGVASATSGRVDPPAPAPAPDTFPGPPPALDVTPIAPAIPSLGPSSGLVTRGPALSELPDLAPGAPRPGTFSTGPRSAPAPVFSPLPETPDGR